MLYVFRYTLTMYSYVYIYVHVNLFVTYVICYNLVKIVFKLLQRHFQSSDFQVQWLLNLIGAYKKTQILRNWVINEQVQIFIHVISEVPIINKILYIKTYFFKKYFCIILVFYYHHYLCSVLFLNRLYVLYVLYVLDTYSTYVCTIRMCFFMISISDFSRGNIY